MDINLTLIISTFFFTSVLVNLPRLTRSDGDCPYPCFPPPGGAGTPTVTTTPPPPSQSAGSYSPPVYPTPTGNLPYNSPPPFGNNLNGPPPPDAILPYFPYYYRRPLHQNDASSATSLPRSTLVMTTSNILASAFLYLVFSC